MNAAQISPTQPVQSQNMNNTQQSGNIKTENNICTITFKDNSKIVINNIPNLTEEKNGEFEGSLNDIKIKIEKHCIIISDKEKKIRFFVKEVSQKKLSISSSEHPNKIICIPQDTIIQWNLDFKYICNTIWIAPYQQVVGHETTNQYTMANGWYEIEGEIIKQIEAANKATEIQEIQEITEIKQHFYINTDKYNKNYFLFTITDNKKSLKIKQDSYTMNIEYGDDKKYISNTLCYIDHIYNNKHYKCYVTKFGIMIYEDQSLVLKAASASEGLFLLSFPQFEFCAQIKQIQQQEINISLNELISLYNQINTRLQEKDYYKKLTDFYEKQDKKVKNNILASYKEWFTELTDEENKQIDALVFEYKFSDQKKEQAKQEEIEAYYKEYVIYDEIFKAFQYKHKLSWSMPNNKNIKQQIEVSEYLDSVDVYKQIIEQISTLDLCFFGLCILLIMIHVYTNYIKSMIDSADTIDNVISDTKVDNVISDAKVDNVISDTKVDNVISDAKVDNVISDAKVDNVISDTKVDNVISDAKVDNVISDTKVDNVISDTKVDNVISDAKVDNVISDTKVDNVISDTKVDNVISDAKVDNVISDAKVDNVISDTQDNDDKITEMNYINAIICVFYFAIIIILLFLMRAVILNMQTSKITRDGLICSLFKCFSDFMKSNFTVLDLLLPIIGIFLLILLIYIMHTDHAFFDNDEYDNDEYHIVSTTAMVLLIIWLTFGILSSAKEIFTSKQKYLCIKIISEASFPENFLCFFILMGILCVGYLIVKIIDLLENWDSIILTNQSVQKILIGIIVFSTFLWLIYTFFVIAIKTECISILYEFTKQSFSYFDLFVPFFMIIGFIILIKKLLMNLYNMLKNQSENTITDFSIPQQIFFLAALIFSFILVCVCTIDITQDLYQNKNKQQRNGLFKYNICIFILILIGISIIINQVLYEDLDLSISGILLYVFLLCLIIKTIMIVKYIVKSIWFLIKDDNIQNLNEDNFKLAIQKACGKQKTNHLNN